MTMIAFLRAHALHVAAAILAAAVSVTLWTVATASVRADAAPVRKAAPAFRTRSPWVVHCTPGEAREYRSVPASCVNLVGTRVTLTYTIGGNGILRYHGTS